MVKAIGITLALVGCGLCSTACVGSVAPVAAAVKAQVAAPAATKTPVLLYCPETDLVEKLYCMELSRQIQESADFTLSAKPISTPYLYISVIVYSPEDFVGGHFVRDYSRHTISRQLTLPFKPGEAITVQDMGIDDITRSSAKDIAIADMFWMERAPQLQVEKR